MLRSLARVAGPANRCTCASKTSSQFVQCTTRSSPMLASSSTQSAGLHTTTSFQQQQTTHAISNPTLAAIEKRWEQMAPQEQADLWMQLRDRMKVDWHDMTLAEKKASYWIAFGPHGPRALPPPGEGLKIFTYTAIGIGVSFAIFLFARSMARPAPSTLNKEWQEKTNEYLKEQKTEPISGISSQGYQGKGYVQSGPKRD